MACNKLFLWYEIIQSDSLTSSLYVLNRNKNKPSDSVARPPKQILLLLFVTFS